MKKNNHSKSGLSIVELLISLLVGSIMVFAGSQLFNQLSKSRIQSGDRIITDIMENIGNRQMWKDLRRAGHSMNVLTLLDDNNQNFFDLNLEIPCGINSSDFTCSRAYTLSPKSRNGFIVLTEWSKRQIVATFNPAAAYNIGVPASYLSNGTLGFSESKLVTQLYNEGLCAAHIGNAVCGTATTDPAAQKFLLLKSAGQSPQIDANGIPIPNSILRSSNVLISSNNVIASGGRVNFLNFSWLNRSHSENSSIQINSIDQFLRTLSPLGGRAGLVQAYEVRAVRYCLDLNTVGQNKNFYSLFREQCNALMGCATTAVCNKVSGGWGKSVELASKVKSIIFRRPNINLPIIYFDLVTDK